MWYAGRAFGVNVTRGLWQGWPITPVTSDSLACHIRAAQLCYKMTISLMKERCSLTFPEMSGFKEPFLLQEIIKIHFLIVLFHDSFK